MDDVAIVGLFFARSEEAVAELAKKYGPLCRRLAENLLGDPRDAEECLNDAWLAVWNTVPPQRPNSLSSYVCRIVRNLAVRKYREKTALKRYSPYDAVLEEMEACFPAADTPEGIAEAREAAEAVDRWLASLDRESRVLFVRRCWYADPIEDLAARFGTSRHNISVRLSRLRKALRAALEKEGVIL